MSKKYVVMNNMKEFAIIIFTSIIKPTKLSIIPIDVSLLD